MLPDRDLQLLTASVDGELSSQQRRQLERLLHGSEEARQVLHRLQEDARRLGSLPVPSLSRDLSAPILQTIVDRRLTPARPRKFQPQPGVPFWKGLVAAAAVLLMLGVASYLCFAPSESRMPGNTDPGPAAVVQPPVGPSQPGAIVAERIKAPRLLPPDPPNPTPRGPQGPPAPVDHRHPEKGQFAEGPKPPEKPREPAPEVGPPKESPGSVLTDRGLELFDIKVVQLNPPLILPVADLEQEQVRQKLQTDLGKSNAYRLELPVHDSNKAVERLRSACKSVGVNLIVEQMAQGRLRKSVWKTNYVIYLETLSPTDLTRVLQHLAHADKQSARKPSEAVLDRLVLACMNKNDWHELSDLLGSSFQPPAEQGGSQTEGSKPASKGSNQTGLVVSMPPVRPTRNSVEIKALPRHPQTGRAGDSAGDDRRSQPGRLTSFLS